MTRKPTTRILRGCLTLLCLASLTAAAADKPKRVKYVAPSGFAGYTWGELRDKFDRLPGDPIGVAAAWTRPVEKAVAWTCVSTPPAVGRDMTKNKEGCDFNATLLSLRRNFEGGGFYVLSEYTVPDQGFRIGNEQNGVVLHPVVYQFCANWDEVKKEVPPNFDAMNKFCGMRLMFQSESREELAKLPPDHVTVYDRMLDRLVEKYGRPNNFVRRGQVVIETEEGEFKDQRERKFSIWRWCPARDRAFHTTCDASVVLSIDPKSGKGTVLYSTPLLWEYAYARENNGFKGDRLFKVLHARN